MLNKKDKFGKAVYITVLSLLLVVMVFATAPSQTFLSDSVSYFKGLTGFGETSPTSIVEIQDDGTTGALFIDQNGNGKGIVLNSEATTANAIEIYTDESTTARGIYLRSASATSTTEGIIHIETTNAGFAGNLLKLENDGTGKAIRISSAQDVEVLDFDACTDGGTSHTTIAGSIKVEMPDGTTGYINFYN